MFKVFKPVSMTYVAYVCLLLGFVMLGTFVYAVAAGSGMAGVIGASLVVSLVASVVGFRVGARNRAESNDSGIPIEGANIWAQPLRREQIDRYLSSYRGGQDGEQEPHAVTVIAADSQASIDRRAA
ncbi:MAG TPA: hypothetical protein VI029_17150 [Mycobacterium sp.]